MPENNIIQETEDYIQRLQNEREEENKKSQAVYEKLAQEYGAKFTGEELPPFEAKSYLYARSYPEDIGHRPFAGINFWNSPDLQIMQTTANVIETTNLEFGRTYQLRCTVRNDGDIPIPSAKVEFYLVEPTLGFDTRLADPIAVQQVWVDAHGLAEVTIPYTVQIGQQGHKCFFARLFSLSPVDLPTEVYELNPSNDRHVIQQNVNITPLQIPYTFQIMYKSGETIRLQMRSLGIEEVYQHLGASSRSFKPLPSEKLLASLILKPQDDSIKIAPTKKGYLITFNSNKRENIRPWQGEKSTYKKHSHQKADSSFFDIDSSGFHIDKGTVMGIELSAFREESDKPFGGITVLFIQGK